MVKQKRVQTRSTSGKKRQQQAPPDVDEPDEGDWMVVKKQKITILIPPLPNKVQPGVCYVGEVQLPENPLNTNYNYLPQLPLAVYETKTLSMPLSPELVLPPLIAHPNETNLLPPKPSSLSHLNASGNSLIPGFQADNNNRATRRVCIGSSAPLDRRIRAVHLDKKLKKAGGLKNWLSSLGLTCFLKFFQNPRRANTFQLVRLDMKKLKDMGADAVGPRRKLMHAIDCLCEPHCFQRFRHCS